MGWVMMSERGLNRIEVLAQIDDGKLGIEAGAAVLDLTKRQTVWTSTICRMERRLLSATTRLD